MRKARTSDEMPRPTRQVDDEDDEERGPGDGVEKKGRSASVRALFFALRRLHTRLRNMFSLCCSEQIKTRFSMQEKWKGARNRHC